jgi:hypothetical protein
LFIFHARPAFPEGYDHYMLKAGALAVEIWSKWYLEKRG